jgi:molybdate-binding protein/DNA-binding XRE family transcriptional regulator
VSSLNASSVHTKLAALRKGRKVGAAALARRVGVTRQTIHAIEAGRYLPNTEVALRLAREFGVAVEDLFCLSPAPTDPTEPMTAAHLGRKAARRGQAVRTARVGGQWVSVPAEPWSYHLPEADAVVDGAGRPRGSTRLDLLTDPGALGNRIVLAGCDPATSLLARMAERHGNVEVVHAPASSRKALEWLGKGSVHIAGSHLEDPRSGEFNLPFVRRRLPRLDAAIVTFARWEEGLVVLPGNPKEIRRAGDLAARDVSLINREPGSGSRALLDRELKRAGVPPSSVRGYDRVAFGHLPAAHAVLSGEADCCIATESAARVLDLDFVGLRSERYDFVVGRTSLELPPVRIFFEVLSGAGLRRKLEILAGYDTSETGEVRA